MTEFILVFTLLANPKFQVAFECDALIKCQIDSQNYELPGDFPPLASPAWKRTLFVKKPDKMA